ncbi:recombinase family protein [Nocardia sp. NPDC049190]|uniref:recombinase family protein n=1 Tax=Nocardia sp. NPDC049190 TaxID=3155650 RepID=UPI0033DDF49E
MVGFGRVPTTDQNLDRQIHASPSLDARRFHRQEVRKEHRARRTVEEPGVHAIWRHLVLLSLDRLGRSLQDLVSIVTGLRKRGIGFRSLHEAIDTTTSGGRLVFHVFAALAVSAAS